MPPARGSRRPPLGRVVDIFAAVEVQPPTGITTFALPQRHADQSSDLGAEVSVRSHCDEHGCVDGLFDHGKTLIAPRRDAEEQFDRGVPFQLERAVHVVDRSDDKLSVYVATSEDSGGAHANNALHCRTSSRTTGKQLRLREVLSPRSAALVLAKVRILFDPMRAIDETGESLPQLRAGAANVDEHNFRIEQHDGRDHVVLCVSSDQGDMLEIRVDGLPVDFLLR